MVCASYWRLLWVVVVVLVHPQFLIVWEVVRTEFKVSIFWGGQVVSSVALHHRYITTITTTTSTTTIVCCFFFFFFITPIPIYGVLL